MPKTIDELHIRISGRAVVEKSFEMGKDIRLVVVGSVVKEETSDNQDGTVNVCYVLKPVEIKEMEF